VSLKSVYESIEDFVGVRESTLKLFVGWWVFFFIQGTSEIPYTNLLIEPAFTSKKPVDVLRQSCVGSLDSSTNYTVSAGGGYDLNQGLDPGASFTFSTYICVIVFSFCWISTFLCRIGLGELCCVADFSCLETSLLWRDNAATINEMLYEGYRDEGNHSKPIGEYPVGKSHVSDQNFGRNFVFGCLGFRVSALVFLGIHLQSIWNVYKGKA
jgi:hypothetical protein